MFVQIYSTLQQNIESGILIDYMSLLLLLPLLFAMVEFFYRKKSKKGQGEKIYFYTHSQIVLLFYVAIQLFLVKASALPIVFAMAVLAKIVYMGIFSLLKKVKPKQKKVKVSKVKKCIQALPYLQEEMPPKALQKEDFAEQEKRVEQVAQPVDDAIYMQKDIHITHIYKTLESLRRQKLTAGDRLECKKIEEILKLYQMKERLTAVETTLLNDILASLLKMMAKYAL